MNFVTCSSKHTDCWNGEIQIYYKEKENLCDMHKIIGLEPRKISNHFNCQVGWREDSWTFILRTQIEKKQTYLYLGIRMKRNSLAEGRKGWNKLLGYKFHEVN